MGNAFEGLIPKTNKLFGKVIGKELEVIDIEAIVNGFSSPERVKIDEYVYSMEYTEDYDYNWIANYFKHKYPDVRMGGCTSVRNGNFYGRNLDWYIDNEVEFVVKSTKTNKRNESIGIVGCLEELDKNFVESGKDSEMYKALPFFLEDGINEYGVVANINVVPTGDYGYLTKTTPKISHEKDVCMLIMIRYILDNFKTAQEAVEYIDNYVSIYIPLIMPPMQEVHAMVADKYKTYVLEFINNTLQVIDVTDAPYMTNFYLYNTVKDASGHMDYTESHLSKYSTGIERYNHIVDNYTSCDNLVGMKKIMREGLRYTNSYRKDTTPLWLSEFCANNGPEYGDLTIDMVKTNPEAFTKILERGQYIYEHRDEPEFYRKGILWQTVHTSVYDIKKRELTINTQENTDKEWKFSLSFGEYNRYLNEEYKDMLKEYPGLEFYESHLTLDDKIENVKSIEDLKVLECEDIYQVGKYVYTITHNFKTGITRKSVRVDDWFNSRIFNPTEDVKLSFEEAMKAYDESIYKTTGNKVTLRSPLTTKLLPVYYIIGQINSPYFVTVDAATGEVGLIE